MTDLQKAYTQDIKCKQCKHFDKWGDGGCFLFYVPIVEGYGQILSAYANDSPMCGDNFEMSFITK